MDVERINRVRRGPVAWQREELERTGTGSGKVRGTAHAPRARWYARSVRRGFRAL